MYNFFLCNVEFFFEYGSQGGPMDEFRYTLPWHLPLPGRTDRIVFPSPDESDAGFTTMVTIEPLFDPARNVVVIELKYVWDSDPEKAIAKILDCFNHTKAIMEKVIEHQKRPT